MSEQWDLEKAFKFKVEESFDTFGFDLPITYALSIGLSKNTEEEDLKYTYENHEDFTVFPTFGCTIPKSAGILQQFLSIPGVPSFNPMMLLHGEQITEYYRPLQIDTKYASTARLTEIVDKGKGFILGVEINTSEVTEDGKKELAIRQHCLMFIRQNGGFGFKGKGVYPPLPEVPKKQEDASWVEKTEKNQALLYRLTGDLNPLHADPNMAAMGGFDTPILHGMNFYALSAKALIKKFCKGDDTLLLTQRARFLGHVFPGESILFKFWIQGDDIIYEGYTVERKTKCITGIAKIKSQPKL